MKRREFMLALGGARCRAANLNGGSFKRSWRRGFSLKQLGAIFLSRFSCVVAMFELKAPPVAFPETSRTGAYNLPVRPGHPLSICVSWSSSRG